MLHDLLSLPRWLVLLPLRVLVGILNLVRLQILRSYDVPDQPALGGMFTRAVFAPESVGLGHFIIAYVRGDLQRGEAGLYVNANKLARIRSEAGIFGKEG